MEARPLAGKGVVVTRPAEQAAQLAELLRAQGARPILFPALEIAEPAAPARAKAIIERLGEFDLAAFVSPTAVARAFRHIRAWPARLPAAAVGQGSARELAAHGVADVIAPRSGADSEALLALPQMQEVRGKRIVVFRGEGGRELLGETLRERGASVEYAEVYRRARPSADPRALLEAWSGGEVHAVTISSAAGLRNLFDIVGERGVQALRATPLFAGHERVASEARRLGVREATVAGASDAEMLAALVAYFGG